MGCKVGACLRVETSNAITSSTNADFERSAMVEQDSLQLLQEQQDLLIEAHEILLSCLSVVAEKRRLLLVSPKASHKCPKLLTSFLVCIPSIVVCNPSIVGFLFEVSILAMHFCPQSCAEGCRLLCNHAYTRGLEVCMAREWTS